MPSETQYGYGCMTQIEWRKIFRGRDLQALKALERIYGGDTDDVINALHSLAARVAIACECDPKLFAEGVQYHWQSVVDHLNDCRDAAN